MQKTYVQREMKRDLNKIICQYYCAIVKLYYIRFYDKNDVIGWQYQKFSIALCKD